METMETMETMESIEYTEYSKPVKSVSFDLDKNEIYSTYSLNEYDRYPIYSTLYLKCYNRISDQEWMLMYQTLNYYKMNEMIVHKESLCNTHLHTN